jgi:hypothetical protein
MEMFKHDEMQMGRGGEVTVGSAPKSKVVALWAEDDTDPGSAEMAPSEARALAALLLKHADRAEGKPERCGKVPWCALDAGHVGLCGVGYTFAKRAGGEDVET